MFKYKLTTAIAVTGLLVAVLGWTSLGQAAQRLFLPSGSVGTAQLKKSAVTGSKIKNGTLTGSKIKNGTLTAAKFRTGQLPAGPQGPKGDPGPQGPKGDTGPAGSFPDVLPTGKTLRGEYSAYGDAANLGTPARDAISFGFALASAPTEHFIPQGGPDDPSCPGTAAVPQAAPGHLCVYENVGVNATGSIIVVSKYGAIVRAQSAAAGLFGTTGTWAVTAP
jgi:hypothetical protein